MTPDDPVVVGLGKRIYAEQCASCHGAGLEGEPNWKVRGGDGLMPAPPHDATGHTWHHDDASLFGMTKLGLAEFAGIEYETNMPAFKDTLSDEQILAALSFIKSTWPEHIRQQHDLINQRAKGS